VSPHSFAVRALAVAGGAALGSVALAAFGLVRAHAADDTVGAGVGATVSALGLLVGLVLGVAVLVVAAHRWSAIA
jgi:hypothetical protein